MKDLNKVQATWISVFWAAAVTEEPSPREISTSKHESSDALLVPGLPPQRRSPKSRACPIGTISNFLSKSKVKCGLLFAGLPLRQKNPVLRFNFKRKHKLHGPLFSGLPL